MQSLSTGLRSEHARLDTPPQANLKPGQLITGKVLELYPNQKASIQLGGSKIVAQLETSLASKQDYLFQVTSVGAIIQLKKISEAPIQNRVVSDQLMQQIGLSNNRDLKTWMQHLLNQNIPFTTKDGQAIANIIAQFGGSGINQALVQMMLQKGLPLTEQVFSSLKAFQSRQLGPQISQLHQLLQQTGQSQPQPMLANLQQQLAVFGANNSDANTSLRQFVQAHQQTLLNTNQVSLPIIQQMMSSQNLTTAQLHDTAKQLQQVLQQQLPLKANELQTFEVFLNRFSQAIQQDGGATESLKNVFQQHPLFSKVMQLLPQSEKVQLQQWLQQPQVTAGQQQQIFSILQNLINQQLPQQQQNTLRALLLHINQVDKSTLSIQNQFIHIVKHFVHTSGIQDESGMAQALRSTNHMQVNLNTVMQSIMSLLPQNEQNLFQNWLQQAQPSSTQIQQMVEMMQRINLQQLPQTEQAVVRNLIILLEADNQPLNKEQMLQLIRQSVNQSEGSLQSLRDQDFSLKQNLLQANQLNTEFGGERIQRLIQTLTGMQINLAQTDQALSQQNFHIPGERFGLAQDIRLQFEGKQKSDSDEIDPDYCRILFHLDLNNLGETMMTLSIQKRVIHITVYNDEQELKPLIDQFKPILRQKLDVLNYQLSSVSHKSLNDTQAMIKSPKQQLSIALPKEGIDFRV